jgi:hypothetical protein
MANNRRGLGRKAKLTAMRDQNFQELLSTVGYTLPTDGPANAHEPLPNEAVGASKNHLEEELEKQVAFSQFLKHSLPNRKAPAQLIQSIQDRINLMFAED